MYSGTTLTRFSGRIIGGHQKIDRVAYDDLEKIVGDLSSFPTIHQILHFEGRKGPDAIKRKSPSKDEPFHFYSPFDDDDDELMETVKEHFDQLVIELKAGNKERAAFEAAWMAHALVDGLTPAHHYPYQKEVEAIWGSEDSRNTIRLKWFPPGDTARERLRKSWKVWGARGLISAHVMFELGVAVILAPLTMPEAQPSERELKQVMHVGVKEMFKRNAREIASLDLYKRFLRRGWSTKVVYDIRHKLGPTMAQTVCLMWYAAMAEAELIKEKIVK
jgi:hypothetical protein